MDAFKYETAFCRNLGWLTPEEQQILRGKRVAIAGLGGVGGSHLLTLTRLGIGAFHIADADTFELANFNRQTGATLNHLGRLKDDVLKEMAADINPGLEIRTFPQGVNEDNVNEFIEGVDIYVDGLDFFAVGARRMVFAACAERLVPAVTAAPLGTGAALLNFLPGKMTFEEYFQMEGCSEQEQLVRFLVGLSPAMLQRGYLVHPEAVDLAAHKGPSTAMACEICAGVAATEALKILLKRGKVLTAPHGLQFDPYRNRLAHTWRPKGNRNPIQKLGIGIARRKLADFRRQNQLTSQNCRPKKIIEEILDLARWAPSGDNLQPWRFEFVTDNQVVIHAKDQAGEDVYDYNDGQPSWLSFGFLLESLRIAGTRYQRAMRWEYQGSQGHEHRIEVVFENDPHGTPDHLLSNLLSRSVDRRRYRLTPLTAHQKKELETALGPELTVRWWESLDERWQWAKLNAWATDIRMTIPETFPIHQHILDWENDFSATGVPAKAVGVDAVTRRLMQWAMKSWNRVNFLNKYLGGTVLPRIELDLIPSLCCAAHFTVVRNDRSAGSEREQLLKTGMALQRMWLTADKLDLVMQPSLAPLAFAAYAQHEVPFSNSPPAAAKAKKLEEKIKTMVTPDDPNSILFLARIGNSSRRERGTAPRSVRRLLADVLRK